MEEQVIDPKSRTVSNVTGSFRIMGHSISWITIRCCKKERKYPMVLFIIAAFW